MTVIKQAIILAGGKGTRLRSVAPDIPKPLVKIGEHPVLVHQIRLLVRYGVTEIFLATNYLADQIEQVIGDGRQLGANVKYHVESEPLGTTGSVKALEDRLNEDFFVLNGDTMLNMDLTRMSGHHFQNTAQATLALHPNDHPYDSDLVDIDEHQRITDFFAKPRDAGGYHRNLVNAGVYVLSKALLRDIEPGVARDFGRDIFPNVLHRYRFFGYLTREYIKDMGTPDRLTRVREDHLSGMIDRRHHDHPQPAVFLDRDGVLVRHVDQLHRVEDLELLPGAASAVRAINRGGRLAVVVTNQPMVARNLGSEAELRRIHDKLDTLLGAEGAYLDRLYYCPHHPDGDYPGENPVYKIPCDCRKPRTGMLTRAMADLNIDMQDSIFIGDSVRDIECARAMNIPSFGVRSGVGCRDAGHRPADFMFDDVAEAVAYVSGNRYRPVRDFVADAYTTAAVEGKNAPFMILIGGNSRAGKSTLAREIALDFRRAGRSLLHVCLDDWLVPASRRTPDMGVLDRFQTDVIDRDLRALLDAGGVVRLRHYDPGTRETAGPEREMRYNGEDVVLVEGVVALCIQDLRERAGLTLFCDIDQRRHARRFKQSYLWKGFNEPRISELLRARMRDEFTIVQACKKFAHKIISSATD